MSFDWQTEDTDWREAETPRRKGQLAADLPAADDSLFAALEPVAAPTAERRQPRGRLRFALVAGMLLLALAAVIYWQLTRRAGVAQERLTAEVIASHEIVGQAAQAGDAELFVSFLSGRDAEWARAQERLARAGGFLDRSVFDLALVSAGNVTPTVTLAPDLRSAELVTRQAYTLDVGNGLTQTVTLEQTSVFRQGTDRWLLSPPATEFWGETVVTLGRHVLVSYPQRDAAIAEGLARDLDETLAELCGGVGEGCEGLGRMELILSPDPASLVAYDRPEAAWRGGRRVEMPAPTLFGRPVDEDGYRAVYRAYATRLAGAAMANLSGWQCCRRNLFYGALRDVTLARLGLRAWPLTDGDYAQFAGDAATLDGIEQLWFAEEASAGQRRAVAILVEFLAERDGAPSPIAMQRLLLAEHIGSFPDWLINVTGGSYSSEADLMADLQGYAAERAGQS